MNRRPDRRVRESHCDQVTSQSYADFTKNLYNNQVRSLICRGNSSFSGISVSDVVGASWVEEQDVTAMVTTAKNVMATKFVRGLAA